MLSSNLQNSIDNNSDFTSQDTGVSGLQYLCLDRIVTLCNCVALVFQRANFGFPKVTQEHKQITD